MSFLLMTALATLSTVIVVIVATSALVALTSSRLADWFDRRPPDKRATALWRLRLLPVAAACLTGICGVLPLFVWFEPRETHERIPAALIGAGCIAVILMMRIVWRVLRSLLTTELLIRTWTRLGTRLTSFDAPFPVYVIDDAFPTIAVIGLYRPVLVIAARVLRECSADEVRAIVAHEVAHVRARDNLKRLVIHAVPTLWPAERRLERAWTRASEEAADAAAARVPALALPLAEALVRIARLASARSLPAPVSSLHAGGDIEPRVRRLLSPGERVTPSPVHQRRLIAVVAALAVFALLGAAPAIHQLLERVIAFLP